MSDEHLQKTLAELVSQRDRKSAEFTAEIKRLETAIEAIKRLVQPEGQAATASTEALDTFNFRDGATAVVTKAVQAGDFFGKSQADAAQVYLKRLGRASTVEDIFSALQRGGAKLQGKDPKKNLYISLVKRKAIFALVAPYTFGLWEFYPDAKEGSSGQGRIAAQIGEVMQDGNSHRVIDVMKALQDRFSQRVSRATVTSVLMRGDEYRKVRRGTFRLKKQTAS